MKRSSRETIMISAISNKQFEYIVNCTTALEITNKFDKFYNTQSITLQILCIGNMDQINLKHYDKVREYFSLFEKGINEFTVASGKIEEK